MAKGKRRATGGGWRQVAPLVPLALFASAFTVSATDDPAVATASLEQGPSGKDPVVVPATPIVAPANVPVPGVIGHGVDPGEQPTQVVSGLSRNGIPTLALKAYSRPELTKATQYCQAELAKVTITKPTQDQLQKCVTAYQTGGTKAVDQVIRNLLSMLGLLGVLGGGLGGS